MEMILMIGIPGSGKSTFCEQHLPNHRLISLDLLHTRFQESKALEDALADKVDIVIDNTNVSRAERARFIERGKAAGYRIIGYYLQSKIADCLKRNAQRTGKKRIPDVGVIGRARQLELPKYNEGFDELHYVSIDNNAFVISDWKKEEDTSPQ